MSPLAITCMAFVLCALIGVICFGKGRDVGHDEGYKWLSQNCGACDYQAGFGELHCREKGCDVNSSDPACPDGSFVRIKLKEAEGDGE